MVEIDRRICKSSRFRVPKRTQAIFNFVVKHWKDTSSNAL